MGGHEDCIFCKIASGAFGTDFLGENAHAVAFRDIQPQAPTHILVVPRRHVSAMRDLTASDAEELAATMLLAAEVAEREGLHDGGYRITTNDGPDAGQTVFHLHFHVLGGRKLNEPLG